MPRIIAWGKTDVIAYSVTVVVCLLLAGGEYAYCHPPKNAYKHHCPSCDAATSTSEQTPNAKTLHTDGGEENGTIPSVRVILPPDRHGELAVWINLVLAAVGVIGLVIGVFNWSKLSEQTDEIRGQRVTMEDTLGVMQEQTKHLRVSVRTAMLSAQVASDSLAVTKSKERARLSIENPEFEIRPFPVLKYTVTCTGTTPAYIESSWVRAELTVFPDFGWPEDAFGYAADGLRSVTPPGDHPLEAYILGTDYRNTAKPLTHMQIGKGELYLHFRVRIEYKDVFGDPDVLEIAKIYGVKKRSTLYQKLTGVAGLSSIYGDEALPSPTWYLSDYKYGEYPQED